MTVVEEIAKIRRVSLGWEDRGILTCMVDLDFGGSAQGCGGYELDEPQRDAEGTFTGRRGSAFGMEWIARLMRVAGVDDFADVQGRTVLALRNDGRVVGLKPLPTEPGKPFIFDELWEEFANA